MRKLVVLFVFLLNTLCVCAAESRLALLIANGTYKNFSSLATPVKEARDLKKSLETLGFSVVIVENASREKMSDALYDFQKRLEKSGGIGFFHYGGHAVQVSGKNYLIPSDADIPDERRIASRALDCDEIMASMQANVNIVVLDSCRNNPLSAGSGRSASRGLVLTEMKPKNSIIVYSAQAGKTAQDGVFTPILTQKILEKKSFTEVLMDVRKEVRARTAGEQSPGEYNELEEAVYLAGFPTQKDLTPDPSPSRRGESETSTIVVEDKSLTKQPLAEKQPSAAAVGSWYVTQAKKALESNDYSTALYYLKQDKSAEGYYLLGTFCELGLGGQKQSNSKAVSLYKKALDYPPALYKMGVHQTYKDLAKAREYWLRAVEKGEARAAAALAIYSVGTFNCYEPNKQCFSYMEQAAELGYSYAEYLLGYYYENGKVVQKDLAKAALYYKRASEDITYKISQIERAFGLQLLNGENYTKTEYTTALAKEKVGDCYFAGLGVEKDEAKAREYYQKAAAEITDANWLSNTANAAVNAKSPNDTKGFIYYSRAAELGSSLAESNLGWCYRYGRGVKQSDAKAVEWWEKAAAKGSAYSQDNLGVMYYNGWGVAKDTAKGIELWKQAAQKGDSHAQEALKSIGVSWQ